MHYCPVCKKLMVDEFRYYYNKHHVQVFWRRELTNLICDKCLEEGWRINIDGNLVLVDLNDAYDPVVHLSDYIMNEEVK